MSDAGNQDALVVAFGEDNARKPEDLAIARAHDWMEYEKLDYDAFKASLPCLGPRL